MEFNKTKLWDEYSEDSSINESIEQEDQNIKEAKIELFLRKFEFFPLKKEELVKIFVDSNFDEKEINCVLAKIMDERSKHSVKQPKANSPQKKENQDFFTDEFEKKKKSFKCNYNHYNYKNKGMKHYRKKGYSNYKKGSLQEIDFTSLKDNKDELEKSPVKEESTKQSFESKCSNDTSSDYSTDIKLNIDTNYKCKNFLEKNDILLNYKNIANEFFPNKFQIWNSERKCGLALAVDYYKPFLDNSKHILEC